jgi:UDP-glucose:(heptosyl)LPS alpha-1,3-glucosyltransferase
MRLAIVHKRFDRTGGAEWECYELSRQLAARGHEIHLVVGECRVAAPDGIRLHKVPMLRAGQLAKLLSFAAMAPRVWRGINADVVIGFGRTIGPDIFRASECHREYLERTAAERGGFERLRQRLSLYERAILNLERRQYARGGQRIVLAVSELSRRDILSTYPMVRPEDIAVLHCGADIDRFHPGRRAEDGAAIRRELGIELEKPLVLFVGSGFRRKGVDTLLDIWRREPPAGAALVIVGNDQQLAARAKEARALGGPVIVTGPRSDMERFYAAADLFALPSLYEGCPVSILEALASGVPVVTSRATGAPELLTGELAELLVDDPRDAEAVAARIRLGLDPARRSAFAAAARAAGVAASLSGVVDRLESWCRWIAAEKGRAPLGHRVGEETPAARESLR